VAGCVLSRRQVADPVQLRIMIIQRDQIGATALGQFRAAGPGRSGHDSYPPVQSACAPTGYRHVAPQAGSSRENHSDCVTHGREQDNQPREQCLDPVHVITPHSAGALVQQFRASGTSCGSFAMRLSGRIVLCSSAATTQPGGKRSGSGHWTQGARGQRSTRASGCRSLTALWSSRCAPGKRYGEVESRNRCAALNPTPAPRPAASWRRAWPIPTQCRPDCWAPRP